MESKRVIVYPAMAVLTQEELSKCSTEKCQCHYNAMMNCRLREGIMYVEGYVEEEGVAHAVNKLPDGTYFDATNNILKCYNLDVVKEYDAQTIDELHRKKGKSYLTIIEDK